MREWSMTNANHWVRVIEAVVKSNFLRAFGRARAKKRAGSGPAGEGEECGEMDALRNKFKRTSVEFEPQLTRGASPVTCDAEVNIHSGVAGGSNERFLTGLHFPFLSQYKR